MRKDLFIFLSNKDLLDGLIGRLKELIGMRKQITEDNLLQRTGHKLRRGCH